jgi:hypothetical protein
VRAQAERECGCSEKNLPRLCGFGWLGGLDVSCTDIGIMIGGWILSEVSEFNAFIVGPSEVDSQFQFDKQIMDSNTIALSSYWLSRNPRV